MRLTKKYDINFNHKLGVQKSDTANNLLDSLGRFHSHNISLSLTIENKKGFNEHGVVTDYKNLNIIKNYLNSVINDRYFIYFDDPFIKSGMISFVSRNKPSKVTVATNHDFINMNDVDYVVNENNEEKREPNSIVTINYGQMYNYIVSTLKLNTDETTLVTILNNSISEEESEKTYDILVMHPWNTMFAITNFEPSLELFTMCMTKSIIKFFSINDPDIEVIDVTIDDGDRIYQI